MQGRVTMSSSRFGAIFLSIGLLSLGLMSSSAQAEPPPGAIADGWDASVDYFIAIGSGTDEKKADGKSDSDFQNFQESFSEPISGPAGSARASTHQNATVNLGPGNDSDGFMLKSAFASSSLSGNTSKIEDPDHPGVPVSNPSADFGLRIAVYGDAPVPYVISSSVNASTSDDEDCSEANVTLSDNSGPIYNRSRRGGGQCAPTDPSVGGSSGLFQGNDTLYELSADADVSMASEKGSDAGSASYEVNFYVFSPCTKMGTAGPDTLTGTAGKDVICGLGGADTIDGAGGPDIVFGGDGGDTIFGGSGADRLVGGAGDDDITGAGDADLIFGNDGDDSLGGGAGDDHSSADPPTAGIFGGDGSDILSGGEGMDLLDGEYGKDTVSGGPDADSLVESGASFAPSHEILAGDGGNDVVAGVKSTFKIEGGAGDDFLVGWTGEDKIEGGDGDDQLTGLDLNDELNGGRGSDTLLGGDGNDILTGGTRKDSLQGGNGQDTLKANDGVRDIVNGGPQSDKASVDDLDDVTSVETLL
ncbi:MAG: hypothetical protein QOH90_1002 [Actinomycetota bacterium]|nr:hypothetical protein [Actinomycetota bacterium]